MQHIALVSNSKKNSFEVVRAVATSLNIQIARDFSRFYDRSVRVVPFARGEAIPTFYWPVTIEDRLDVPDAGGYHDIDQNNVPYAKILHGANWSLDVSHEILEMLGDPYGGWLVDGVSLQDGVTPVKYL